MASRISDSEASAGQPTLKEVRAESARLRHTSEQILDQIKVLLDKSYKLIEQSKVLEERLKKLS